MKKIIFVTVLFIFSNNILANSNDGNLFLKYCSYKNKAPESLTDQEFGGLMFCYGSLHGIDAMQQVGNMKGNEPIYCPPKGYGVTQGSSIFIKYMNDHPELLHMSGSGLMVKALIEAFPCQ